MPETQEYEPMTKAEFLRKAPDGIRCPRCGSSDVDAGAHESTKGGPHIIDQGAWCLSCNLMFELIYELSGYKILSDDRGEGNEE